jgi:hypothetical protein
VREIRSFYSGNSENLRAVKGWDEECIIPDSSEERRPGRATPSIPL